MRLPKSQVSTAKQPTIDQVTEALNVVAFYVLKMKKKTFTNESVDCEAQRIERCIEEYYVKENHEMQFLEFASNFLVENYKELVFGSKFDGSYLSSVKEPSIDSMESVDNLEYSVLL
jgi:hypothetical protein